MAEHRSEFLSTVTERGFIHQCTALEELDAALAEGEPKLCYIGFDCTADSLHVGSLMQIMMVVQLLEVLMQELQFLEQELRRQVVL